MTCVESHGDTFIEYQRTSEAQSSSDDFMVISFYHQSKIVANVELQVLNSPDLTLQTQSIGLVPKWDAITIGVSGNNGGNLEVLRIKENSDVVLDLIARKKCDSIWLDGNFGETDGCYFGSASFDRDPLYGTGGNFHLDFCTGQNRNGKSI